MARSTIVRLRVSWDPTEQDPPAFWEWEVLLDMPKGSVEVLSTWDDDEDLLSST